MATNTQIFSWDNIPAQTEAMLLGNDSLYSKHADLIGFDLTAEQAATSLYFDLCGIANRVLDARIKDYLTYQF